MTGQDTIETVLEHAGKACTAFGREDLLARIEDHHDRLRRSLPHVVVVGEFKQGKSSLVNALVGASVCPVDDDIATAVPTFLHHGTDVRAEAVYLNADTDTEPPPEPEREPADANSLYGIVTEQREVTTDGRAPTAVDVWLPRRILEGMVVVDTPGVGGLGSPAAVATLGALAVADAVIFVTDASQELTRPELDTLRRAADSCDTLMVALTKTDFHADWRRILELDAGHLRSHGIDAPIVPVSSPLRSMAVRASDRDLNLESGYPVLVERLDRDVVEQAALATRRQAAMTVIDVCDQLTAAFRAEREALADPARARAIVDELTETKARTERLRSNASKWNQTLTDGVTDLVADVDHDYRERTRRLLREADDAIENSDPADTWAEFEPWLYQRIAYEVLENYTHLRDRAAELSAQVADHFEAASGEVLDELAVYNPAPAMASGSVDATIDVGKMSTGAAGFTMLRGGYMGVLMFTMIGSMVGLALTPVAIGVGMIMGRKSLKEEKERQLANRRAQAKNAMRRYTDEVTFHVNKDSRDTLRRVQRQLRDHYSSRAEDLHRSTTESLKAATAAAGEHESTRTARIADLDAELGRLTQLRNRAEAQTQAVDA